MNDKDKIKLANAIKFKQRYEAKDNYYNYVKYVHDDYEYNRHGEFISNVINDAIEKRDKMLRGDINVENQYIMLSVPPRHGKSMHISETLPSYFMGKYPKGKVILTAYSSTLAHDFAQANSSKIKQYNVFDTKIEQDNQERTLLGNGSICVKAGILGGITGKGAHLLIIDDPIKTAEEARSEVHREKVWREWISSLSTRLEKAAIVIVIMTRWHEDDLIGRLLNKEYAEPLPWNVINLPLECDTENDVLGRKIGEPLWAERYGYDFIEVRKRYPEDFNSLYQGRPSSQEGNVLKRHYWNFYNKTDEFVRRIPTLVLSVDAAFKGLDTSDNVAIHVWGKIKNDYFLVDITKAKMDFNTTIQAIRNMLNKYPNIGFKFVEDKANGTAIMNVLHKEIGGIVGVNPMGDKVSRANSVLPYLVGGNIYLPREETFIHSFIEECASFPNGKNDDDVDAFTQAISQIVFYIPEVEKQEVVSLREQVDNEYTEEMNTWETY